MRIALIKNGQLTLVGAMAHLVDKLDKLDSATAGASATGAVSAAPGGGLLVPLAPREAASAANGAGIAGAGGGRVDAVARAEHDEVMAEICDTLRPFFQVCALLLLGSLLRVFAFFFVHDSCG